MRKYGVSKNGFNSNNSLLPMTDTEKQSSNIKEYN